MITLASDFGTPYPAAMKGVVLQRTDARLVDIGHEFPRHDVRSAAFWLREVCPWFPPAVHLVVVDPGVGTDRAAVAVRAGDHAFVAPDNGVVVPVAREIAGQDGFELFEIDGGDPASSTFHGRDVFAPAAALVHETGTDRMEQLEELSPTDEYVDLVFPEPEVEERGATAEVLVVDDFGNAITNLPGEHLPDGEVSVDGEPVPVGETFGAVDPGERVVTVGSHGNVELDVNRGRGDEAFGLAPGDEVRIEWR